MTIPSDVWIEFDHLIWHSGEVIPVRAQVLLIALERRTMRVRMFRKDNGEYFTTVDRDADVFFENYSIVPK